MSCRALCSRPTSSTSRMWGSALCLAAVVMTSFAATRRFSTTFGGSHSIVAREASEDSSLEKVCERLVLSAKFRDAACKLEEWTKQPELLPQEVKTARDKLIKRAKKNMIDIRKVAKLPKHVDVYTTGGGFRECMGLGVSMMLHRAADKDLIQIHRKYGSSGGGQSTIQLAMMKEIATLEYHLAYGHLVNKNREMLEANDTYSDFFDELWMLLEELMFTSAKRKNVKTRLGSNIGVFITNITHGISAMDPKKWWGAVHNGTLEEGVASQPVLVTGITTVELARKAFYITGDWHFNSTLNGQDTGDGNLGILHHKLEPQDLLLPDKANSVIVLELCYKHPDSCENGDTQYLGNATLADVVTMYEQGQDYGAQFLRTGKSEHNVVHLQDKTGKLGSDMPSYPNKKISKKRRMRRARFQRSNKRRLNKRRK